MNVLDHLKRWPWPFPAGAPVVIGVSGGVDSMVLADAMARLRVGSLVVAHVHHGLRGSEADDDEALVRDWAASHGCAFESTRAAVAARAREARESLETAGRALRRAFFREVAGRHGASHVVLAHHADDQAETLLMNLVRGAGTHGLSGMRPVASWRGLWLVRPLLGLWRAEIEAWARSERLVWREDASNRSAEHWRNRVRHGVLPALEQAVGRPIRDVLRRTAELAAADDDALEAISEQAFVHARLPDGALSVPAVRDLNPAIARRVLRAWLREQSVPDVGFEQVEAVRLMAHASGRPASCNLGGARRVRRRAGRLFVDSQRTQAAASENGGSARDVSDGETDQR